MGDARKVTITFVGGPWDGDTREVEAGALARVNAPGQYRLDAERAGEWPLRYVWVPERPARGR